VKRRSARKLDVPVPMLTRAQYAELRRRIAAGEGPDAAVGFDLPLLGEGVARHAYLLEVKGQSPRVIKIFDWENYPEDPEAEYVAQMEHERHCLDILEGHPLVPTLYEWGETSEFVGWLELELLRPGPSSGSAAYPDFKRAFKRATGIPWLKFAAAVDGVDPWNDPAEEWPRALAQLTRYRPSAFLDDVATLVHGCELAIPELARSENWGLTEDGRPKVLDVGMSYKLDEEVKADDEENPASIKQRLLAYSWPPQVTL
jgi:hypothetical protein